MLTRLANYLRGATAGADDSREDANDDGVDSFPVEARLRQVEVEGDDWILIDRNVEGATPLDESWYVTPPACFTRAGPVHVETSPLEDLLIEHPSMSVYRSAAPPGARPETPSTSKAVAEAQKNRALQPVSGNKPPRLALGKKNLRRNDNPTRSNVVEAPRRSSIRDLRNARGDENVRIVQLRSAQKMLENRSSEPTKRNRLERGNKVREVSSGKGRRPRRQDRLRLINSGANNNRKC